jgi:hypothetical protein
MSNPIADLLNTPIPRKLWHYTSLQGFQGIVSSKAIFATDFRFLNDREEVTHAFEIAKKIVSETPEFEPDRFPVRFILKQGINFALNGPLQLSQLQVFVASFTAMEDQLSQWRGYSYGTSGASLALDLADQLNDIRSDSTLSSFAPCIYDSDQKNILIRYALHHLRDEFAIAWGKHISELRFFTNEEISETFREAASKMFIDLFRIAALVKNPSFAEEQEWRLVIPFLLKDGKPRFRATRTTLVPYIAHPFAPELPLIDLILGPGSDENSIFAARKFLMTEGIGITPRLSSVPYRSL